MGRAWGWLAVLVMLVGCSSAPAATVSASAAAVSASIGAPDSAVRVTVPALSASGSVESTSAGSSPPTLAVSLVNCDGCTILGTYADVVPGFAAALILSDGRAALLSLDPSGTVVGILNVPYGVTFGVPPGGELPCGAGGRCVVVGAQPDGRAILSAFELATDGSWRDVSGTTGFVSATGRGMPVLLEDALGVAVQVSDGATTVWTVLGWNGTSFAVLGCAPDADAPDLAALAPGTCLS